MVQGICELGFAFGCLTPEPLKHVSIAMLWADCKHTHFSTVRVIVRTRNSQAKAKKCVVTSRLTLEGWWGVAHEKTIEGWVQGHEIPWEHFTQSWGPWYLLNKYIGHCYKCLCGFPGGSDGKESACSAGHPSSIPGLGRSPGGGNGYAFQYSCLRNPMDRGAWRATVHGGGLKKWDTTAQLTLSLYQCVYPPYWNQVPSDNSVNSPQWIETHSLW